MKIREFTFVPEDKDHPIKIVYEDDLKITHIDDCTFEITGKVYGIEAEKIITNIFGTTNLGVLDCSDMSDEEINGIADKWNSIPEEYPITHDDLVKAMEIAEKNNI